MRDPGQVIRAGHGANNNVAAVAAIPTIGTSARDIFLAPEAAAAPPPVATFDVDCYAIDKHRKK
jgi:hypothetical protein